MAARKATAPDKAPDNAAGAQLVVSPFTAALLQPLLPCAACTELLCSAGKF
jgi:hypothetical protein